METTALVTIIVKGLISAALAGGGVYALVKGAGLFRDGVGLTADGSQFELKNKEFKVKVTASSVGAVVMVTAGIWGWLAKETLPAVSFQDGNWDVAGIEPQENQDYYEFLNGQVADLASLNRRLQAQAMNLNSSAGAAGFEIANALGQVMSIVGLSGRMANLTQNQGALSSMLEESLERVDKELQEAKNKEDKERIMVLTRNKIDLIDFQKRLASVNNSADQLISESAKQGEAGTLGGSQVPNLERLVLDEFIAKATEVSKEAARAVEAGSRAASARMM